MAREFSRTVFDSVRQYIKSQGWKSVKEDSDNGTFRISFSTGNKLKSMDLLVFVLNSGFCTYGLIPFKADNDSLDSVAEFLTRANYGMNFGNFELDYNDGEVRFKSSLHSKDGRPSPVEVEFAVDLPMMMWERYGNAFLSVLVGGENPAKAVAAAEA